MRARERCLVVAAGAIAFVVGASASAQGIACAGINGYAGPMIGIAGTLKNAPFTGTVKTTFEQRLADGNAIHKVTHTREARDSAGRTMTEMAQGCVRGEDGQFHERLSVNVHDPVARTSMSWQVGDDAQPKVAHLYHQPELPVRTATRPQPGTEELERQQKMMVAAKAEQARLRRENKTEDLGVRDFDGVQAHGMRTTRTIPSGEEGNDQPLVVINETWQSKELGLTVMWIRDDPRTGRTVNEYEELQRGEPEASLFSPPSGYTVQERAETGPLGLMVQ
jgi:hypothetical protein